MKKTFAEFFRRLGRYKWSLLAASIFSLAGAILNLLGPGKLSDMTDTITQGLSGSIDLAAVTRIAVTLVIFYVAGFALNYLQGWIMATDTQLVTRRMRKDISRKINRLPLSYFDRHPIGDTLSRITNDVDTVGQTMNQSLSTLISSLALLLGSVIMMFATNAVMAIAGIAAACIGFALSLFIISKSQGYFTLQQAQLGDLNGHVEETFSGLMTIKACNAADSVRQRFRLCSDKLYVSGWKSQFLAGIMMPLMIFIGNLAYVAVCVVGAVLALKGSITFGTVVAFMLYIRLFTQPMQNIAQALTSVQSLAAACGRVFEFLDEEEMEDEVFKTQKLESVRGNVKFDHVRFGYDTDKVIIRDFSCDVHAGDKIAIVGPTGAGKTTLVNLLMRFYETNGGTIRIDGVPIQNLKRENVHDLFGMVLQDTWLFEGTLRENLVYNKKNITDEMLDRVCAAAGLSDLVRRLPQGYDTVLSDRDNLSAGQKQLITIARAMLEDAPLLILDEATSSVDTRTELSVQRAMDRLTKGRTSFVIAHRLSTIKNADCILVMKDGDILESGRHEELLEKGGFYAQLYNSQFENAA